MKQVLMAATISFGLMSIGFIFNGVYLMGRHEGCLQAIQKATDLGINIPKGLNQYYWCRKI